MESLASTGISPMAVHIEEMPSTMLKCSLHGRVLKNISKRLVHVAVHPEPKGAREIGFSDANLERCAFETELVALADERDALKA